MLTYTWQFKNGTLGQISFLDFVNRPSDTYYVCYDRSIGDWIVYER